MSKEKKATAQKNEKPKMSFKAKFLLFLGMIACIYFFRQNTVLLLIGLLPSIVALFVDQTPFRSWTKTVFCFNLSGMLPTMITILFTSKATSLSGHVGDMNMWLLAYSAAALAWIVIWVAPRLTHQWIKINTAYTIERHLSKIAKLDEEWNISKQAPSQ